MHTLQLELLAAIGGMLLLMYLTRGRKPKPATKAEERQPAQVIQARKKPRKEPVL